MLLFFNFLGTVFNSFTHEFPTESTSLNGRTFSIPKGKRRSIEPPNFIIAES